MRRSGGLGTPFSLFEKNEIFFKKMLDVENKKWYYINVDAPSGSEASRELRKVANLVFGN